MAAGLMNEERPWPAVERLAHQLALKAIDSIELGETSEIGNAANLEILVTSISRGQAAGALASEQGDKPVRVTLFEFEHYRSRILADALSETLASTPDQHASSLSIVCESQPPKEVQYDISLLTLRRDWGAELSRDLLQSFAASVKPDGQLIVIVDHPDDGWIGDLLREASKSSAKAVRRFTCDPGATGYVVAAQSLKVGERDFRCQFAFRHVGHLIQAVSRPGVFAHRKLDLGARRLIDAMEIEANNQVLDIGCGSGVVSFAAALSAEGVSVTAIDSNSRAIECTIEGARLNQLEPQITAVLCSDGAVPNAGTYDIALGNPPYFANFQIAELFLQTAHDAVRPGGKIWFVAKQPDWYNANVPRWFDGVKVTMVGGGYCVAFGIRPQDSTQLE